jgi:hypothetical protein
VQENTKRQTRKERKRERMEEISKSEIEDLKYKLE